MAKLDELDIKILEIVCRQKCKFYKEDQEIREKEYQCGAYKVLKTMIEEKYLSIEDLKSLAAKIIKTSLP